MEHRRTANNYMINCKKCLALCRQWDYFLMFRHQIQHYTQQLAKDSSTQLKELNNYSQEDAMDPRQWKLQRERLQHDFTKALDNFQRAQRSAVQKEKGAIKKSKNQGVRE